VIGRLQGILEYKQSPHLLIMVNGVGYEVQAPMSTIYQLPAINQMVSLHTHFVVREDAQLLYGFFTEAERSLFRTLIKVSGVGPKLALAVLSGMEVATFIDCIEQGLLDSLVRVPGVGKKTAERLIIEMRDKLQGKGTAVHDNTEWMPLLHNTKATPTQDAISALISLGYKSPEATRAVNRAQSNDKENSESSEMLIRKALKELAKA